MYYRLSKLCQEQKHPAENETMVKAARCGNYHAYAVLAQQCHNTGIQNSDLSMGLATEYYQKAKALARQAGDRPFYIKMCQILSVENPAREWPDYENLCNTLYPQIKTATNNKSLFKLNFDMKPLLASHQSICPLGAPLLAIAGIISDKRAYTGYNKNDQLTLWIDQLLSAIKSLKSYHDVESDLMELMLKIQKLEGKVVTQEILNTLAKRFDNSPKYWRLRIIFCVLAFLNEDNPTIASPNLSLAIQIHDVTFSKLMIEWLGKDSQYALSEEQIKVLLNKAALTAQGLLSHDLSSTTAIDAASTNSNLYPKVEYFSRPTATSSSTFSTGGLFSSTATSSAIDSKLPTATFAIPVPSAPPLVDHALQQKLDHHDASMRMFEKAKRQTTSVKESDPATIATAEIFAQAAVAGRPRAFSK